MKNVCLALGLCLLALSSTAHAQQADVMAAVTRFVDGFNKSDAKMLASSCAEQTSILDEFPPHEWHGAGACLIWMKDYETDAKKK